MIVWINFPSNFLLSSFTAHAPLFNNKVLLGLFGRTSLRYDSSLPRKEAITREFGLSLEAPQILNSLLGLTVEDGRAIDQMARRQVKDRVLRADAVLLQVGVLVGHALTLLVQVVDQLADALCGFGHDYSLGYLLTLNHATAGAQAFFRDQVEVLLRVVVIHRPLR